MYTEITDAVGVVTGGTNVGVVRIDDRHVVIVDSGLNDTIARRVLRAVKDELNSEIVAIVTTHGHADHFGAHAFVHQRTGASVHAPELEACIIEHPELQPTLLYGGADPIDDLKNRFLQAEACRVDAIIDPGATNILGADVQIVPLPGHSLNQQGFVFDTVFFCADVVFPKGAIEKYKLPYLYGLSKHLESLERCLSVPCSVVVPGHGPLEESIEPSSTSTAWSSSRPVRSSLARSRNRPTRTPSALHCSGRWTCQSTRHRVITSCGRRSWRI